MTFSHCGNGNGVCAPPICSPGLGGLGFALSITAVVVLVMLAARTLVGIPARVFGGSAWQLTRDRVGGTAGAFVWERS